MEERKRELKCYSPDEIIKIIDGYKLLNVHGTMEDFLKQASECKECKGLRIDKKPLNRILNYIDLKINSSKEAKKIERLYKAFKLKFRREHYEPIERFNQVEGGDAEFYNYVMKKFWPEKVGLSIGVCGWTDAALFLNKSDALPKIMIVASDWYPLRAQSSFLIESEVDNLLNTGFAGYLFPGDSSDSWKKLIETAGVYYTNAMLCYRPGNEKTGSRNLSSRSFINCAPFLEEQIKIVKPELIISWGVYAAKSLFCVLRRLSGDVSLKAYCDRPFAEINKKPESFPLPVLIGEKTIHYHPLYHPSARKNYRWGKQGDGQPLDYANLREWLAERNIIQLPGCTGRNG